MNNTLSPNRAASPKGLKKRNVEKKENTEEVGKKTRFISQLGIGQRRESPRKQCIKLAKRLDFVYSRSLNCQKRVSIHKSPSPRRLFVRGSGELENRNPGVSLTDRKRRFRISVTRCPCNSYDVIGSRSANKS